MFTVYPLTLQKILYNRSIGIYIRGVYMGILTLKNDEFRALPDYLQDYARYNVTIKGNSEKTVIEYVSDIRTFFRFLILIRRETRFREVNLKR